MLLQLIATGLIIGGAVAATDTTVNPETVRALTWSGTSLLTVGRVVDAWSAPYSARDTALEQLGTKRETIEQYINTLVRPIRVVIH